MTRAACCLSTLLQPGSSQTIELRGLSTKKCLRSSSWCVVTSSSHGPRFVRNAEPVPSVRPHALDLRVRVHVCTAAVTIAVAVLTYADDQRHLQLICQRAVGHHPQHELVRDAAILPLFPLVFGLI